jgi:hypothetical protein
MFKSLLLTFYMESIKSKSAKVLRKLTSPETRPNELFGDLSNFRGAIEGKRSTKQTLNRIPRGT